MIRKFLNSFLLAFHNIRSHFFHTLLSILGIVIGVAALVSILSLIDGLEMIAKEQITQTTSLNSIVIQSDLYDRTNGVRILKDSVPYIKYADYLELKKNLTKPNVSIYRVSIQSRAFVDRDTIGVIGYGADTIVFKGTSFKMTAGGLWRNMDEVVVNERFIEAMKEKSRDTAIGKSVEFYGKKLKVAGVFADPGMEPRIVFPVTQLTEADIARYKPDINIEAVVVEDVIALKDEISKWLKSKYNNNGAFSIFTNEARVKQSTQAFMLFRLVMGFIVGISVVVGGIGIMNVLLISITERTVEIGIRKAVGATSRDIILQFLAEAITVSIFGCFFGMILGVLMTEIAIPIITSITKLPFRAEYTVDTLLVVSSIALLLGITFGTYPAVRASNLDPVEAIRRE